MSHQFRELLKKVGSGQHTKKDLTRAEAAIATKMMLTQEATPAQIGAFMIAHRIKRPTGEELAGMLDAYDELGTKLKVYPNFPYPVTVLGIPYDGRSRTSPVNPLIALMLASVNVPVILHGGDRIPTKYGIPLIEIFQGLGIDFSHIFHDKIQEIFEKTNLGFVYIPTQFILAQNLIPYRDEIGKRSPFSTVELVWLPYEGETNLIAGYVHPPTEKMIRDGFFMRGNRNFTLVKGLEGSPDLSLSKTTIVVVNGQDQQVKYLKLNAHDYNLRGEDIPLESKEIYLSHIEKIINGEDSPLMNAVIWNGGFYLSHCGICDDISSGLELAKKIINEGKMKEKVEEIKNLLKHHD
jgi:anthranilate phosphoribosyltransferase